MVMMSVVSDLEYIFPQDLKMWAKSAGRHFLEAQEKIKAFMKISPNFKMESFVVVACLFCLGKDSLVGRIKSLKIM